MAVGAWELAHPAQLAEAHRHWSASWKAAT